MKKKSKKPNEAIDAYRKDNKKIPSDIFGSYTGLSVDNEKPIQDADDI